MIVAMVGLPSSGKSTLAETLARLCGGVVLNKDTIRRDLFADPYLEYTDEQDDFCQTLMLQTSEYLLTRHPDLAIFLDGRSFSRRYQIDNVAEAARRLKTTFCVIECFCSDETARARLEDLSRPHPARNRTFALYRSIQERFEPILHPKCTVDTDRPLDECVVSALAYLGDQGARIR